MKIVEGVIGPHVAGDAEARDASVVFLGFDEHHIRLLIDTSDLHSAKAKQINIIQPPTPNAETHSSRAKRESNLHTTRAAI